MSQTMKFPVVNDVQKPNHIHQKLYTLIMRLNSTADMNSTFEYIGEQ